MALTRIVVEGYRGFAKAQSLTLALPNGERGGGLTILVGANNAGKSTVVEALRDCSGQTSPTFTEGRRNEATGKRVRIELANDDEERKTVIQTVAAGGSEATRVGAPLPESVLAIPSRRHFRPYFSRSGQPRDQYVNNLQDQKQRGATLDSFAYRLFEIQNNREKFNKVLAQVLSPVPEWVIEQADNGEYYLKFSSLTGAHNSEGMGEGLVSLFVLVDALYDSEPGHVIVIDEPELSLHPSLQRRLANLFAEYSKDRQIIVATHSPYFVDLSTLVSGARIARVHLAEDGSRISQLSPETAKALSGLMTDAHNPHVLGLDAREAFFLDECIVLVEGQEDVMHYRRVTEQAGVDLPGHFFGWGVGGASKMKLIATLLHESGFRRVVGLLDSDKEEVAKELLESFPDYRFECIPAKDVRTKDPVKARPEIVGLLDKEGNLRAEYAAATAAAITRLAGHLTPDVGAV